VPIYEYQCTSCAYRFEVKQSIKDEPVKECTRCGKVVMKLISPPAIMFKGSGWYITDYSDKMKPGAGSESTEKPAAETDKTKTPASTDAAGTAPAAAPAAATSSAQAGSTTSSGSGASSTGTPSSNSSSSSSAAT
jgi:putative FmdB family regulatory protein